MGRNPVQFQKGMSLGELVARYGSEAQCREALFRLRWPKGFVCPECASTSYCELNRRALYQCHRCHHQSSLTAGSLFHGTRLSLRTWFLAIFLLTQRKKSISALELRRQLGINYNSAWLIKHKLMQAMLERNRDRRLRGRIELDDAYLGGERHGQGCGRGTPGKQPFIIAVQTSDLGRPVRLQLRRVRGFRKNAIRRWANTSVEPGSLVVSDGMWCFRAVRESGCQHQPILTGGTFRGSAHPAFKWANTILGNVKNALRGTFHAVRKKHAPRYLAEFEYRFNRRFDLPAMIERLAYVCLRTPPMPYQLLTLAERYG